MKNYNIIDKNKDGFVILNDKDRPGHDFSDFFPYVKLNHQIYITDRVFSNQLHTVRKGTRIIIYIK